MLFLKTGLKHSCYAEIFCSGVHEAAAEQGRVVVSGHAANVGVVGWTLGGGHGQLVPLHGMGVDQVYFLKPLNLGKVSDMYVTTLPIL